MWLAVLLLVLSILSDGHGHANITIDRVPLQLREFKSEHPLPVGLLTTSAGAPVDIRSTINVNKDIFANDYHVDTITRVVDERIPERVVHAKGNGAFGYFIVTNDVSKYTSADVFNGVGKKTPVFGRFSVSSQNLGGTELQRDIKGLSLKMYTKEGNLDFLCLHTPVFELSDPIDFPSLVRSARRNPKTNIPHPTMRWDQITKRPGILNAIVFRLSDYGIPFGYRRMNIFPIHAYELHNKHGDRYLAKFNFRTELGLANLTMAEATAIGSQDPNFFTRDMYNAIENKKYPSWRLEIDVMSLHDATELDYNPFDITRVWKKGTYKTVTIGRLVFDKVPENHFRSTEQSVFNPAHLVPGIPGPVDFVFKARRLAYRDAHKNRVGSNADNVRVNQPLYRKTNNRDGPPPVRENMEDIPNYYPNSFNGPIPMVDESRPSEKLLVLDRTSIDLEPLSYFYNHFIESDAHRQRIADNAGADLVPVDKKVVANILKIFSYIDPEFGRRSAESYRIARRRADAAAKLDTRTRYAPLAKCMSLFEQGRLFNYNGHH